MNIIYIIFFTFFLLSFNLYLGRKELMAKETLELYRQKARGLAIAISTAKYKSLEKGGLPERDKKSLDQLDEELKKLAARLGLNGEKKRTIDKESGLPHFE